MARGRFISESVAKDLKLNSLSVEAELVYLLTIPHLDRDGLIEGDTDILFGTVCPKRRQFIDRMGDFVQEWVHVGLVTMYDSDNGPVLWFRGFAKNQTGMRYDRETPSKFPLPPAEFQTTPANIRQTSGNVPEASDKNPQQVQVEVKDQVEVKGEVADATPQQEMFAAVCEAIGWDYKTLTKDDKGQVAQAVGIFVKHDYTVDDIRRFMVDVWFKDWRWVKETQHPTLKQLRQEIGKIRSTLASVAPPAKTKGINGYRDMLAGQGIDL